MSDDFVAGDHGEETAAPLGAGLVDVGVADAAVVDGEDDVVGVGVAAVEGVGGEGGGFGLGGVAEGFHGIPFVAILHYFIMARRVSKNRRRKWPFPAFLTSDTARLSQKPEE